MIRWFREYLIGEVDQRVQSCLPGFIKYASGAKGGGRTWRYKVTKNFHLFVVLQFARDRDWFEIGFAWSRLGRFPDEGEATQATRQIGTHKRSPPWTLEECLYHLNEGWATFYDIVPYAGKNELKLAVGAPTSSTWEKSISVLRRQLRDQGKDEELIADQKPAWGYVEIAGISPSELEVALELGRTLKVIEEGLCGPMTALVNRTIERLVTNPEFGERVGS